LSNVERGQIVGMRRVGMKCKEKRKSQSPLPAGMATTSILTEMSKKRKSQSPPMGMRKMSKIVGSGVSSRTKREEDVYVCDPAVVERLSSFESFSTLGTWRDELLKKGVLFCYDPSHPSLSNPQWKLWTPISDSSDLTSDDVIEGVCRMVNAPYACEDKSVYASVDALLACHSMVKEHPYL
jgi:hypothetical protein